MALHVVQVYGNACGVVSPTEYSVVVVAAEIQDTQTAKETFGSDAAGLFRRCLCEAYFKNIVCESTEVAEISLV
jgi:hypothetical protein